MNGMIPPLAMQALSGLRLLADETRWKLILALRDSDRQVTELVAATGLAQNLISYHLHVLRQADIVSAHRSDADGRVVYYSLNLNQVAAILEQTGQALALPAIPPPYLPPVTVVFLCRANSARSQMAEGWLRKLSDGQIRALSAGTRPQPIHPLALAVMAEAGIPIDQQIAKPIAAIINDQPDLVVTVCDIACEECPVWPETPRQIHWSIADPAAVTGDDATRRAAFVAARDAIRARVQALLAILPRWFPERQPARQSPSAAR